MNDAQLLLACSIGGAVLGALVTAVLQLPVGSRPNEPVGIGRPIEAGAADAAPIRRQEPTLPLMKSMFLGVSLGLVIGFLLGLFVTLGDCSGCGPPPSTQPSAVPEPTATSVSITVPPETDLITAPPVVVGCQGGPFQGWKEIMPRNGSGEYNVALKTCELLWFNSGSVILGSQRLGGEEASRNTVLLYLAEQDTTIRVAIGDAQDLGNEWLALTQAGIDETIAEWSVRALGDGNCTGTCSKLSLFEYHGERLAATNTVTVAASSGPCAATKVGVLTSLQNELWQFGGGYLQVEYYSGSEPERETILPFDTATTGFRVLSPLSGYVWSYSATCTLQEVEDSVRTHVADRKRLGHNNLGLAAWETTTLFEPILAGG